MDARYLSESECLWHLFGFQMQYCYPEVQKLQLHLHHNHQIVYTEGEEAADLDRPVNTSLTGCFDTVCSKKNDPFFYAMHLLLFRSCCCVRRYMTTLNDV